MAPTAWGSRVVSSRRHVRRVGHDAGVQHRVVREHAVGPQPHALARRQWLLTVERRPVGVAAVDGAVPVVPLAERIGPVGPALLEVGQRERVGDVGGHRQLVVEALLVHVERRLQVEDGAAVLDGHDASGGERATVADAVDVVEDRHARIAGTQEVGVQRVHLAVGLDGAGGGHQRLAGHLPTEHPLGLDIGARAPEDVDLDRLEVEQGDEVVDGLLHATSCQTGRHRTEPPVRPTTAPGALQRSSPVHLQFIRGTGAGHPLLERWARPDPPPTAPVTCFPMDKLGYGGRARRTGR